MADGKPLRTLFYPNGKPIRHKAAVAPAREHSVMVVRTWFGDYVLKPWRPK